MPEYAFPGLNAQFTGLSSDGEERYEIAPSGGMLLRDHFAGQALAGILANPGGPIQANSSSGWSFVNCRAGDVADMAYQMADDMIRAREKEPSS